MLNSSKYLIGSKDIFNKNTFLWFVNVCNYTRASPTVVGRGERIAFEFDSFHAALIGAGNVKNWVHIGRGSGTIFKLGGKGDATRKLPTHKF